MEAADIRIDLSGGCERLLEGWDRVVLALQALECRHPGLEVRHSQGLECLFTEQIRGEETRAGADAVELRTRVEVDALLSDDVVRRDDVVAAERLLHALEEGVGDEPPESLAQRRIIDGAQSPEPSVEAFADEGFDLVIRVRKGGRFGGLSGEVLQALAERLDVASEGVFLLASGLFTLSLEPPYVVLVVFDCRFGTRAFACDGSLEGGEGEAHKWHTVALPVGCKEKCS